MHVSLQNYGECSAILFCVLRRVGARTTEEQNCIEEVVDLLGRPPRNWRLCQTLGAGGSLWTVLARQVPLGTVRVAADPPVIVLFCVARSLAVCFRKQIPIFLQFDFPS